MMLRDQIYEDVKKAMKGREVERLETLRFVWSEVKNAEIDLKREMKDEEVVALLQREVKRRREAIEQFEAGGREELAGEEREKLKIIEAYLPQMMSEDEIRKEVEEVVDEGVKDFGVVMGRVMGRVRGKADGGVVKKLVEEVLK